MLLTGLKVEVPFPLGGVLLVVLWDAEDPVDAVAVVLGGGGMGDDGDCAAPATASATTPAARGTACVVVLGGGVLRLFSRFVADDPETESKEHTC